MKTKTILSLFALVAMMMVGGWTRAGGRQSSAPIAAATVTLSDEIPTESHLTPLPPPPGPPPSACEERGRAQCEIQIYDESNKYFRDCMKSIFELLDSKVSQFKDQYSYCLSQEGKYRIEHQGDCYSKVEQMCEIKAQTTYVN